MIRWEILCLSQVDLLVQGSHALCASIFIAFPCVGIPIRETVSSLYPALYWVWDILHTTPSTRYVTTDMWLAPLLPPISNSVCFHASLYSLTLTIVCWCRPTEKWGPVLGPKCGQILHYLKNLTPYPFFKCKNTPLVQISLKLGENSDLTPFGPICPRYRATMGSKKELSENPTPYPLLKCINTPLVRIS